MNKEVEEMMTQMSDPAAARDANKMKELSAELGQKRELLEVVTKWEVNQKAKEEADAMVTEESDAELVEMAREDLSRLLAEETQLRQELESLMLPKDPRDSRNVILEIRAGAGGDEAGLFALELFRAYSRYGEENGWKVHLVSSSMSEAGGYKEVVAEISAPLRPSGSAGQISGPFGTLKFESGVHRVQRVPETEKQGRIHTSTVTVAVMPEAEEVDIEIKTEDLKIDTYRASGAGGQHVNKTDSAVRITHLPTNTVVAVQDERSQHKNKAKAMSVLRARLLDAREKEYRKKQATERKSQVGTGDRSEKIRTYNYPQDRITDHRIKKSWGNIPVVMDGGLGKIFEDLRRVEKEKKLGATS